MSLPDPEGDRLIEALLRRDADGFVLTVAVAAERQGRDPAELAGEALGDALARLTESGALGGEGDPPE